MSSIRLKFDKALGMRSMTIEDFLVQTYRNAFLESHRGVGQLCDRVLV